MTGILTKLKFLRAFLIAVKDPTRLDAIFKVTGDPRMMGSEKHAALFAAIAKHPLSQSYLQKRLLPQWDLAQLKNSAKGTLAAAYCRHLESNRLDEKFYPDLPGQREIDFVRIWIRKTHDVMHVLTGFDTSVEGEAGVQAFFFAQLELKGAVLLIVIALLHNLFYRPEKLPDLMREITRGWQLGLSAAPLFGEPFENHWQEDTESYRRRLRLLPA